MGIRLKGLKNDRQKLNLGLGMLTVHKIATEQNQNIKIIFTPKQWRVTIQAFGKNFVGAGKDEQCIIDAMRKLAEHAIKFYPLEP